MASGPRHAPPAMWVAVIAGIVAGVCITGCTLHGDSIVRGCMGAAHLVPFGVFAAILGAAGVVLRRWSRARKAADEAARVNAMTVAEKIERRTTTTTLDGEDEWPTA
jgi:hypothetical protein